MLVDLSDADHAIAPEVAPRESRDLLTQVLLGLRLDGVEYSRCVMRRPWSLAFPRQRCARFLFMGSGQGWLRGPAGPWLRFNAGDAVLLPHGSDFLLASDPDLPAVAVDSLARVAMADDLYLVDEAARAPTASAGTDGRDVIFCGSLRFNLDAMHPLIAMMPAVMRADELARTDPTVPLLLDAMEREVALDRIGACGMLARLADALAASIIRAWVECGCSDATGWIAAVRCPKVGKVVAAIHGDPAREWTVPALAGVMGASRSTFTDMFTRTMGESPARYVAKVKMLQARQWMSREGMRVGVAADRLGYKSEASFSRAFKRITGQAPSASRGMAAMRSPASPAREPLP